MKAIFKADAPGENGKFRPKLVKFKDQGKDTAPIKTLLERVLRGKKGPEFRLDPHLSTGDAIGILWKMGCGILRGLCAAPFLGGTRGPFILSRHVRLRDRSRIKVGRNFIAEEYCEIQGMSKRGIVFGDSVTVGSMAMIRPSGYYGNAVGEGLRVGDRSNIGPYSYVGCAGYIDIGANVMMGPRVSLFAENHNFERTDIPMKDQGVSNQGIVIEDDCWLGSGCIVLDGVRIGKGSVIAAGSVVSKSVDPYSIMAGVPAKLIKSRLAG